MATEIDALLIIWARWRIYRMDAGFGYGRATSLGRAIDLGPAAAAIGQGFGRGCIPGNETAEQMDRLVEALPERFKIGIRLEYLSRDSRKQNAKRLHLSYEAFRGWLRMAKGILAEA